jgi:hypothetical protein
MRLVAATFRVASLQHIVKYAATGFAELNQGKARSQPGRRRTGWYNVHLAFDQSGFRHAEFVAEAAVFKRVVLAPGFLNELAEAGNQFFDFTATHNEAPELSVALSDDEHQLWCCADSWRTKN